MMPGDLVVLENGSEFLVEDNEPIFDIKGFYFVHFLVSRSNYASNILEGITVEEINILAVGNYDGG